MDSQTSSNNEFCTLSKFNELIKYTEDKDNKKITCELLPLLNKISETYFVKVSIFDTDEGTINKDKETINNFLKNLPEIPDSFTHQEKCAMGSMLGMAIGDAMGHRFEFQPVDYNPDPNELLEDMGKGPGGAFQLEPGQWTDDTSMGLCLADSLLIKNDEFDPHDLMLRFLCWWYGGYDNAFKNMPRGSCGLGGNISCALDRYIRKFEPYTKAGDNRTSGNGSLMRNAAVPIRFWKNIDKAVDIARKQSLVTHQGDEARECCALLTYIVVNILKYEKLDLKKFMDNLINGYEENDIKIKGFETDFESVKLLADSKQEGNDINRNWNWKDEKFKYSPMRAQMNPGYIGSYAMDALSMSLHIIYYTDNFTGAIIKAVNLKGDSDSVGSVVGQIAGAYYGIKSINKEWIETIGKWDNNEITLRGYMLARLDSKESKMQNDYGFEEILFLYYLMLITMNII